MTTHTPARVHAGTPDGGRFAPDTKTEPDLALTTPDEPDGDEAETYDEHSNDSGDWCPYSGMPVRGGDDERCPQGCRESDPDYDPSDYCACGESLDDGEGSNGRCGNCADRWSCPECDEERDDEDEPTCRECAREAAPDA